MLLSCVSSGANIIISHRRRLGSLSCGLQALRFRASMWQCGMSTLGCCWVSCFGCPSVPWTEDIYALRVHTEFLDHARIKKRGRKYQVAGIPDSRPSTFLPIHRCPWHSLPARYYAPDYVKEAMYARPLVPPAALRGAIAVERSNRILGSDPQPQIRNRAPYTLLCAME